LAITNHGELSKDHPCNFGWLNCTLFFNLYQRKIVLIEVIPAGFYGFLCDIYTEPAENRRQQKIETGFLICCQIAYNYAKIMQNQIFFSLPFISNT